MSPPDDRPAGRWAQLALVSLAVLLSLSAWLTATAIGPALAARWGLDAGEVGWLTTIVQLGFVGGTLVAAVLNLADVVPARPYFAASAAIAAGANALLLVVPGFRSALVARFLTGFFLAGVYPPSMKMAATWFRASRGLAIGTVVGALTVGKALPYLFRVLGDPGGTTVVVAASAAGLLAALLVGSAYRDGPHAPPRRPFEWRRVGEVLGHRPTVLATAGYLGHMWELYAFWSLVSVFSFDLLRADGQPEAAASFGAGLVAFAAIAVGGAGSVVAGRWADRLGRERIAIAAMAVSGACALVVGWLLAAPPALVVPLVLVWGFAVVADSAQFSAVVTEVAPPHAVGTALTLQTSLGFALTAVAIPVTIWMAGRFGWGPAFALLAAGPAFGIGAMARLVRVRARRGGGV